MAESIPDTMERLGRLENDVHDLKGAAVQISQILVEQSERMDAGFSRVQEELREMRGEGKATRESLCDRLDRLIAVTTTERTFGAERLAELERRLARLEARVGG